MSAKIDRRICVAPMMDWTDRHDRYFLRLIAPHVLLYTEMVTTGAIIYGNDLNRFLGFSKMEHPIALQLGGSDPTELAHSAKIAEEFGYDEVNLNVGCPSDRVQKGRIGACLMLEPNLVAECVAAMNQAVTIPVTVKCRIGVDHHDSYPELMHFIQTIANAGCHIFIIHARKAWLHGLSPKQNREIPPLCYDTVYQIKKDFPHLTIIINGGVKTIDDTQLHLSLLDGVMIGREAYTNPFLLHEIEKTFFANAENLLTRSAVIDALIPYVEQHLQKGGRLSNITRHILGLFQGQKGARAWRRYLSENVHRENADSNVVQDALKQLDEHNV